MWDSESATNPMSAAIRFQGGNQFGEPVSNLPSKLPRPERHRQLAEELDV